MRSEILERSSGPSLERSVTTTELFLPVGPDPPEPAVEVGTRTLSRSNPLVVVVFFLRGESFFGGPRSVSNAACFRSF